MGHFIQRMMKFEQAKQPEGKKTQLKSFLAILNFSERFIPMLQGICFEQYKLTHKDAEWNWGKTQQRIFKDVKCVVAQYFELIPFSIDRPLVLACDASGVGIGAGLFHVLPNGEKQPVMFAPRLLNTAERRYATIEQEALAIVCGVKRLYHYLYGNRFVIETDHKPLQHMFGEKRDL